MIGISAYVLNQRLALAMPYVAQLAYEHLIIPSLTPIFFLHINMYPWIEAPITAKSKQRESCRIGTHLQWVEGGRRRGRRRRTSARRRGEGRWVVAATGAAVPLAVEGRGGG